VPLGWLNLPEALEGLIEDYVTATVGSTDTVAAAEAARLAVSGDLSTSSVLTSSCSR
jgi:hypothetical protein